MSWGIAMRQVRLIGTDAVNYAREHGLEVSVLPDDPAAPESRATPEEAAAIAEHDPTKVWIDIDAAASTAD
jgi:hypothetical protein